MAGRVEPGSGQAALDWQANGDAVSGGLAQEAPGGSSAALADVDVAELVADAQKGCPQSFARLYDRYLGTVYSYILHRVGHRPTAEDLAADVFMRALRRIGTFHQRGTDFGAWLLTIARNRVHDHFKSASFRLEASVDKVVETPSPDTANDPETVLLSQEAARQVRAALRQLKDEHAEVLYLRFIHHLDVPQTAAAMGKSAGAVRGLQHRALRSLAKLVGVPPARQERR